MLRIFDLVGQVASSRSTVLISGESGTGKELYRQGHSRQLSRKSHPFVRSIPAPCPRTCWNQRCSPCQRSIHQRCLFQEGLFEVADGGTIFLDEIGTMSLETQAKILRVLQDRKFMHLGGVQELQVMSGSSPPPTLT